MEAVAGQECDERVVDGLLSQARDVVRMFGDLSDGWLDVVLEYGREVRTSDSASNPEVLLSASREDPERGVQRVRVLGLERAGTRIREHRALVVVETLNPRDQLVDAAVGRPRAPVSG